MDDDSHTAFSILNDYENHDIGFYDILIKTREGKVAFKRFIFCAVFAILTVVSALIPGLPYSLEFTLKAVFCFFAMLTAFNVYISGVKALLKRKATADLLSAVCTFVSYAYALVTGFHWFENGIILDNDFCFIITVTALSGMLFGNFIKNGLKSRSNDAVERLCEFVPDSIDVFRNGQTVNVNFKCVRSGDCAKVLPGEKIPFDAVVVNGETTVDESPLTGESTPAAKESGSKVFAGSINKYGEITVKSICDGENCLICKLIRMAKNELETEYERKGITERVVSFYLPFIFIFSLVVGFCVKFIGFDISDAVAAGAVVFSLACPVAIAFVEPMLTLVNVTKAYKNKILIQNPNVVSLLNDVNTFAFDQNGTLTEGEYEISDVIVFEGFSEEKIIEYAASVESVTDHPISDAIFEYAYKKGIQAKKVDTLEILDKEQVKAKIEGNEVCFGDYSVFENKKFIEKKSECEKLKNSGKIITFITINSEPAAIIAAKDSYKPGVINMIEYLENEGKKTYILSEDSKNPVVSMESFADAKADKIKDLKSKGNFVAMIGDGVNDTVALITADVGISIGNATPAALEASDIIIASNDISDIVKVMNFSKLYKKTAIQNIALSIGFNVILLISLLFMNFFGMNYLSEPVLLTAFVSVLAVFINTLRVKNK